MRSASAAVAEAIPRDAGAVDLRQGQRRQGTRGDDGAEIDAVVCELVAQAIPEGSPEMRPRYAAGRSRRAIVRATLYGPPPGCALTPPSGFSTRSMSASPLTTIGRSSRSVRIVPQWTAVDGHSCVREPRASPGVAGPRVFALGLLDQGLGRDRAGVGGGDHDRDRLVH